MQDCKLIIRLRNDAITFEAENLTMVELAEMCGSLQVFMGMEGLKRGLDMDDVKDNMLDLHLASMEDIETKVRNGLIKIGGDSDGKEDD